MKCLKIGSILIAISLFILACNQGTNNAVDKVPGNSTSNQAQNTGNSTQTTPTPDEFAAARKIYSEKCVNCHKENGEGGDAKNDKDEKIRVPSYKKPGAMKQSEKDFVEIVTDGDEDMPSFKKDLKPEEIAAVVKFIRKEFQGQ